MPVYQPNIPTGNEKLRLDYLNLQGNFQVLDTAYGTDHVAFSQATSAGFHNQVTTTTQGSAPTTGTNPIFYALQQYAAMGVLQYSRGPSNAVPTPLTKLYSGVSAIALAPSLSTSILDFTGISLAIVNAYAYDSTGVNIVAATVGWNGSAFSGLSSSGNLRITSVGNILKATNSSLAINMNIYWALDFVRVA